MSRRALLYGAMAMGLFLNACAQKGVQGSDAPARSLVGPVPTAEVAAAPQTPVEPLRHYQVRYGDNLWSIAGRADVLGDSFRWPLLYRANRDQISDPDLIEASQDLAYKPRPTPHEVAEAVRLAQETPPYAAHSEPRERLPLDY